MSLYLYSTKTGTPADESRIVLFVPDDLFERRQLVDPHASGVEFIQVGHGLKSNPLGRRGGLHPVDAVQKLSNRPILGSRVVPPDVRFLGRRQ